MFAFYKQKHVSISFYIQINEDNSLGIQISFFNFVQQKFIRGLYIIWIE